MTQKRGQTSFGTTLTLLAASIVATMACSRDGADSDPLASRDQGTVVLALQAAPGVTIDSAGYSIMGPAGFAKSGTINLASSTTLSTTIGGLPGGNGFTISITANAVGDKAMCGGSAMFNVTAGASTPVPVHVVCHEPPRTGSISVKGTINICPAVDGVSANPAQIVVGGSIALSVAAHDSDASPAALAYQWTASAGTLTGATTARPTFTCGAPGQVTISVIALRRRRRAGLRRDGHRSGPLSVPGAGGPAAATTLAVYGDAPYGTTPTDTAETLATPAFIALVNADPDVALVVHVGDIHSGKQFCTRGLRPARSSTCGRASSDPLVYTPGDNEWTDCHKAAEGGGTYNATTRTIDYVHDANGDPVDYASGDPIANLALVRSIFFAQPRRTLGGREQAGALAGAGRSIRRTRPTRSSSRT